VRCSCTYHARVGASGGDVAAGEEVDAFGISAAVAGGPGAAAGVAGKTKAAAVAEGCGGLAAPAAASGQWQAAALGTPAGDAEGGVQDHPGHSHCLYHLRAVLVHLGQGGGVGGHWVAYRRGVHCSATPAVAGGMQRLSGWYKASDQAVVAVSEDEVLACHATAVLYERSGQGGGTDRWCCTEA